MARTPGSPLTTSAADLVAQAEEGITTLQREEVEPLLDSPDVLLVDIRDVREVEREGMIPGARLAPRGMLEFWVDPASPYYKPELDDGRRLVLYCGSGWRSALAAEVLTRMGRDDVAHLAGGFSGWKQAGLPVERREKR
ncbi:rhodanese-like domain-containing protein [Luteococcus peritonei]|uniref:Rhodanese-like domain-containing protein n=1 Tax=Luteococcus peritonei TaxID=88874 RepID=A0ABW4RW65_9ACTN